jgi:hypothetical protein
LGLQPRQGLLYEIHGESVTIRPEGESLMDLAGILKGDKKPVSKRDARQIARSKVAQRFRENKA